jgi:hypothetical protein
MPERYGQVTRHRVRLGLGAAAIVFAFTAGIGAVEGIVPSGGAVTALPQPQPAPHPSVGTGGGALPVVPAGGGGCIIGLNCGCVHNCSNQHHQPAPATAHPSDAPAGPGGG